MAGKIKLNSRGIGEVLRSGGVRADLTSRMERALSAAKSNAPVASGAYRDGLHLEQATTDRAVVRIVGSTDHDLVVEADTGNLARALDQAR